MNVPQGEAIQAGAKSGDVPLRTVYRILSAQGSAVWFKSGISEVSLV